MQTPSREECGDIECIQAVMQVDNLRPGDLAAEADRGGRRWKRIRETQPLDTVPDADG